jgi:hypothetical protein
VRVGYRFPCPNCNETLHTPILYTFIVYAAPAIAGVILGQYFHLSLLYLIIEVLVLYFPLFIVVGIVALVKFPPTLQRYLPNDLTMIKR